MGARTDCSVFVGSRMDWLWTAQVLGFEPKLIHFRHDTPLVPLVRRLFPGTAIVVGSHGGLPAFDLPKVAFVHGSPGSFAFLFEQVDVLVSTQGKRGKVPEGWQLSKTRVAHAKVGGVTDGTDNCYLWSRGTEELTEIIPVPTALPRDVHSVISDTVAGAACAKPSGGRLKNPRVMETRPGLYNGGGLFPLNHMTGQFVVRSVFTSSKWCRRRLKGTEIASAFDIPHQLVIQCSASELKLLTVHPSRGLEHCAKALLAYAGIIDRGGGYVFDTRNSICLEKEALELLNKVGVPQGAPQEAVELLNKAAQDLNCLEKEAVELLNKAAQELNVETVEEDDETMKEEAVEEDDETVKEEKLPPEVRGPRNDDRDLKAVKADDAQVPIWLWNDAIVAGLSEPPSCRGHTPDQVDEALETLRSFGLCRKFRLGVTRSYFRHLKNEYPELTGPDRLEVKTASEGFRWNNFPIATAHYQWRPKYGKQSYKSWWNQFWRYAERDREPGKDAIYRAADSSWWEWDEGSAPFYWRWPPDYRETIRDGLEIWFSGSKPKWRRPQRVEKDLETRNKIVQKISKVRKRKYIAEGHVWSLTDFFCVPKGSDDIRMVYNGTSSGLNDVLWVPSFPLPTVDTLLRAVHPGTWMADTDLGEMFLNFVLHESLRELAGVDVTHYRKNVHNMETGSRTTKKGKDVPQCGEGLKGPESKGKEMPESGSPGLCWERWTRCAMGLKPSPYQTTQAMLFAEDIMRGNPDDAGNVFRWEEVKMNLPGDPKYDPRLPWVYKVKGDGTPAADFFFYVDDNRTVGNSELEAWQAARRVASVCSYLGIQDASRKRRKASQTPGAWAGAMASTDEDNIFVTVSQEKWDKSKEMIAKTIEEVRGNDGLLVRKDLERRRGFLLYVTRTFPAFVPYMKGFHLTIDGWRRNRSDDGWKYLSREIREMMEQGDDVTVPEPPDAPKMVKAKARLIECDLPALARLFAPTTPPKRLIRARKVVEVYYGFGDASQDGFGFNIQESDGDTVHYRFGQWCDEVSESTSNYRELYNLVCRLEEMVEDGTLRGAEVFIFTDNSTSESVYFKGNSSSETLFNLTVRLRELEMHGDLILHMLHCAGTRMQDEGADGSSRGDHSTGVMGGGHVLDYVPLHKSALELEPKLKDWLARNWDTARGPLRFMKPKDWFKSGNLGHQLLWTPPPAAADAAAEQMARMIHKYPNTCHLFVCPRLMTARWRRRVGRLADFKFEIGAGSDVWTRARHEPLLIYVCLPLSNHSPWKLRGTKFLDGLERKMRELHPTNCKRRGRLLRKLLVQARGLDALPEGLVRGMLQRAEHKPFPGKDGSRR
jgi:hypothetical protein